MIPFRRFPTMGDGFTTSVGNGAMTSGIANADIGGWIQQAQQQAAIAATAAAQAASYAQTAQNATTIAAISAAELGASNASKAASNAADSANTYALYALNVAGLIPSSSLQACQNAAAQAQASSQAAIASESAANAAGNQAAASSLLGGLSGPVSIQLGNKNPNLPIMKISGLVIPATVAAATAGTKAIANQLTLEYQAGNITLAQWQQAIATLTPSGQN